MEWAHIDWKLRRILVPAKNAKNKTKRYIVMGDDLYSILLGQYEQRISDLWVFAGPRGGHIHGHNFTDRFFRPALRDAGIEDFRWHDLRHTGATWLRLKGAQPADIAEVAGHKDPRMWKRYAHIADVTRVDVMNRLGSALRLAGGSDHRVSLEGEAERLQMQLAAIQAKLSQGNDEPCEENAA